MHKDKLRPSRWRQNILTAWLLIAVGPGLPLLAVLVVLKLWELFWPLILVVIVVLLLVAGYRLVCGWWWRW